MAAGQHVPILIRHCLAQEFIDLCDFDIHQDIDLLASSAHHDHQGFHQTTICRHLCPRSKQYSTKFVMDFPMYTAPRQSLESKDAGKVLFQGSIGEDYHFSSKWVKLREPVARYLPPPVVSIISDFFLSAFPILILRKVQINLRSKIGLCLLMGLGVM